MRLGLIVEGHGEVAAMPLLVRRIATELGAPVPEIPQPHRIPRGKLVKHEELTRAIELMARKVGAGGAVLVLLDADEDCPARLGPQLLTWARAARDDRRIAVVLAKREFEAWLVAAAESLRGARGLPKDLTAPIHPEDLASPKGWLGARMPTGYSETVDQPALAATFEWRDALRAPSFDKLVRDLAYLLGVSPPTAPTS